MDRRVVAHVQNRDRRGLHADEVRRRLVVVGLGLVVHEVFVGVGALAERDVGLVVLDRVGLAQLPGAVDQGEEECRDRERDHDGGEGERLRERIAHLALRPEERGIAGDAHHDQQQQVRGVAEQQEADQHAGQAALQHRVHTTREEDGHDDDEGEGDVHQLLLPPRERNPSGPGVVRSAA